MKYNDEEYQNLSAKLKINRDLLDEEALEQPHLYFHSSEAYTISVAEKDKKKLALELEEANLDKIIREEKIANEEKITDKIIAQEIIRDQDYQRAAKEHIDIVLVSNRWNALKEAYRQRADMIKILQNLYSSGYFGEVTGSAERTEARKRFNDRRS